jgi:DNA transposition AAA+ family ATPase
MITVSPCYATITGVNELLAEELGVKEKVARHIYREIIRKIKDSGRVIIIDEAQHLTSRVINHLRSITDASGVGIAFIGNWEIHSKIYGSGQAAYAQLYSRIGNPAKLTTKMIKAEDIRLVFAEAGLEDDAVGLLHNISMTNYGLRGAVNVFVNAIIAFQIKNFADLTKGRIAKIAASMNIG